MFTTTTGEMNSLWPSDTTGILVKIGSGNGLLPDYYAKPIFEPIIIGVLWHSPEGYFIGTVQEFYPWYEFKNGYLQVSNIRRTLVCNKIVDNSYVVGASLVGAAPTTSSFST